MEVGSNGTVSCKRGSSHRLSRGEKEDEMKDGCVKEGVLTEATPIAGKPCPLISVAFILVHKLLEANLRSMIGFKTHTQTHTHKLDVLTSLPSNIQTKIYPFYFPPTPEDLHRDKFIFQSLFNDVLKKSF